ncbi:uncharacterized protein LOC117341482 [Pecten maximus]|uniref:uncharacterized protein LOC117341482 n=1 Tax=Pecten maximus TaxID=6579 RepID=UPI001458E772|nr:uncharacterized protein LOC117341482 [Pecten maximus]
MVVTDRVRPPEGEFQTEDRGVNESQNRRSIQGIVSTLQLSHDVQLVQSSLQQLLVLAQKNEIHHLLANKEIHECIMSAVSHLDLPKDIQKFGCEVLADLVERIPGLCKTFSQSSTLG